MAAIDTAARLNDIGFAEFTSKLVSDTFQTLVASQIEQTQAFADLVRQTAKSLTDYVNDTKDDISGEELLQYINALLPEQDASDIQATGGQPNVTLTSDEAAQLNRDLAYDTVTPSFAAGATTTLSIREAIAKRIAANKYELLTEIVRLGLIRLVVTDGFIDTKLSFKVEEFAEAKTLAQKYARTSGGFSASLGVIGKVFNLRASGGYNKLKVSFDRATTETGSSTDINIQGQVHINFRSDIPNNA